MGRIRRRANTTADADLLVDQETCPIGGQHRIEEQKVLQMRQIVCQIVQKGTFEFADGAFSKLVDNIGAGDGCRNVCMRRESGIGQNMQWCSVVA